MRRIAALIAVIALSSCGHEDPWSYAPPSADAPQTPGTPLRLTVNPGVDLTPSWLPDGSGIIYASERGDRYGDRCFMIMPPDGGRARTLMCYPLLVDPPTDSLRAPAWPAVSAGGQLAYSSTTSRRVVAGRVRQLKWTPNITDFTRDHHAATSSFDLFGGRHLDGVSFIRWLDETRFVHKADFLGEDFGDSVRSGRLLLLVTISGGGGFSRVEIPGTDHVSGVAVIHPDTILFTRNRNTRVLSLALSTGDTSVIHDFGPGNIARDVHASGNAVVAIVGGRVGNFYSLAFNDTVQIDGGGAIWHLDRATLTARQINADTFFYNYPVLSPDGARIVAQSACDLYLFRP